MTETEKLEIVLVSMAANFTREFMEKQMRADGYKSEEIYQLAQSASDICDYIACVIEQAKRDRA